MKRSPTKNVGKIRHFLYPNRSVARFLISSKAASLCISSRACPLYIISRSRALSCANILRFLPIARFAQDLFRGGETSVPVAGYEITHRPPPSLLSKALVERRVAPLSPDGLATRALPEYCIFHGCVIYWRYPQNVRRPKYGKHSFFSSGVRELQERI